MEIRFHDNFFKDLDKLSLKDLQIFEKKKTKIIQDPKRQKRLTGEKDCYREPITRNLRVVYFLHNNFIWFLTIGPHDKAYKKFKERLYGIRSKYDL